MYEIHEVNGEDYADEINRFNALFPDDFVPLKPRHLAKGHWWLVHLSGESQTVGFAGMVPFVPFSDGYFKRVGVLKDHRGNGLTQCLMTKAFEKAKAIGWRRLVSECHLENIPSANNHIRAGFLLVEAERPWDKESLVWTKDLTK